MIRRMLITEIINHLEKKQKLVKQARLLKKKGNKKNPDLEAQLKEINDEMPKSFYLAEDCHLLTSGGLKKGKELLLDIAKNLLDFGFHIIWTSDKPITEKEKNEDYVYNYKSELENNLLRSMVILDENNAKKPGATIKFIEKNDLLRQTIEAVQLDSTKYLAHAIFGESAKKINALKLPIQTYLKKGPNKIDILDHTCLGNLYKKKKKEGQKETQPKSGKQKEERSNVFFRFMINIALAFMTTISNIQKIRLEKDPKDTSEFTRKLDPSKRHGYDIDQLIEVSLSAIFAEYGYLHATIDGLIQRFTTPYYNEEGKVEGSGFAKLSEKNKLIYDKHCNVSYHIFESMKEKGFVKELARGILQYHHRGLNGSGYPKRKMSSVPVQSKDLEGNPFTYNQNVYDSKINEPTRLVTIISFFVEYFFQTPFHIPFQRDNLVRHMLLNSVFPPGKDKQPDKEGIYEIETQFNHDKRFDGYLVESFLKSVNIYKIDEEIPIYNFNNSNKKLYDAIVVRYNELPHRPVVKIKNAQGEKELDLSLAENESLYISEYIPSLRFQDVIDEYHLDKVEGGILLDDQKADENQAVLNKADRDAAQLLDSAFDDDSQVVETPQEADSDFNIDDLLGDLPPELEAEQANKTEKEPESLEDESFESIEDTTLPPTDELEEETDSIITEEKESEEIDIIEPSIPSIEKDIPIVQEEELILDDLGLPEESLTEKTEKSFEPPAEMESLEEDSFSQSSELGTDDLLNIFSDEKPISSDEESKTQLVDEPEVEDSIIESETLKVEEETLSEENIDSLFDEEQEVISEEEKPVFEAKSVESLETTLYTIHIKRENEVIPYGIGKLVSSSPEKKEFKMHYLSQCIEEASDHYTYHFSLVDDKDQKMISVYDSTKYNQLPFGELKLFIGEEFTDNKFEKKIFKPISVGEYHLLYYIEQFDPKKYPTQPENVNKIKGIPKYIVQIREIGDQSVKPVVTFTRYIKISGEDVEYVKDKNCGKEFDLSNLPFFRIDRSLSAKEIVKFLKLQIS